jgi:hypothetical protein
VLVHLVLFRPKPDLDAAARQNLADALTAALTQIPSVRRVRVGRRVMHGRGYERAMRANYSHIAMLEFDDLAALQEYLQHPAHEQLAAQFFAAFEEALMYDYDVGEGETAIRTMAGSATVAGS